MSVDLIQLLIASPATAIQGLVIFYLAFSQMGILISVVGPRVFPGFYSKLPMLFVDRRAIRQVLTKFFLKIESVQGKGTIVAMILPKNRVASDPGDGDRNDIKGIELSHSAAHL